MNLLSSIWYCSCWIDSSGFLEGEAFFTMVTFFAAASAAPPLVPLTGLLIDIFLGSNPAAGYYSAGCSFGISLSFALKEASLKLDCYYTTLTGLFDSKPFTGGGFPNRPLPVIPSKAGSCPGRVFLANSAFYSTSIMFAELSPLF
jgi:hypothetical protein